MTKTEEALLPCRCGKEASLRVSAWLQYNVRCSHCEAATGWIGGVENGEESAEIMEGWKQEAIKAWNTRTPEGQEMWAIENEDRHLFCIQGDQEKVANNARYFEASNKAKYKVVPVIVTKKED